MQYSLLHSPQIYYQRCGGKQERNDNPPWSSLKCRTRKGQVRDLPLYGRLAAAPLPYGRSAHRAPAPRTRDALVGDPPPYGPPADSPLLPHRPYAACRLAGPPADSPRTAITPQRRGRETRRSETHLRMGRLPSRPSSPHRPYTAGRSAGPHAGSTKHGGSMRGHAPSYVHCRATRLSVTVDKTAT